MILTRNRNICGLTGDDSATNKSPCAAGSRVAVPDLNVISIGVTGVGTTGREVAAMLRQLWPGVGEKAYYPASR